MARSKQAGGTPPDLDLFSISQKICTYSAPFLAIMPEGKCTVIQTNCNHWDCPRCGELRAKHEYGRIVNGARVLAGHHTLYFYTFTCRGSDLPLSDAQRDYGLWTNRLLSTMRARCSREGGSWHYVQVTERQKRGHPHSHLLLSWIPSDSREKIDAKGKPYIYSAWFRKAHIRVGLGTESKITPVGSVEATAKYIAKYLFKDAQFTLMPKNWHRVRYSHSFPKIDEREVTEDVSYITIKTPQDWQLLAKTGIPFETASRNIYDLARRHIHNIVYKPLPLLIDT